MARGGWSAAELDLIHSFGQGASHAGNPFVSQFAAAESNAAWKGMLRPEGGHADDPFRTYTGQQSARRPARARVVATRVELLDASGASRGLSYMQQWHRVDAELAAYLAARPREPAAPGAVHL